MPDFEIRHGAAFLFDVQTGDEIMMLSPDDPLDGGEFGYSVSLWNGLALIGERYDDDLGAQAGAVYLFDTQTGQQLGKFTAFDGEMGDNFGSGVALNALGALVGAPLEDERGNGAGAAYLFQVPEPSTWALTLSCLATALVLAGRRRAVPGFSRHR